MSAPNLKPPLWFILAAAAGLLWNLIGAWHFISGFTATPESLAALGFTPEQVTLMLAEPLWLTILQGLAMIAGIGGCILLLMRRSLASPVLALLVLLCILIYIGNITVGYFGALGTAYVVIMTMVVVISTGLWWLARWAGRSGYLS
jgi:hypothetical protein